MAFENNGPLCLRCKGEDAMGTGKTHKRMTRHYTEAGNLLGYSCTCGATEKARGSNGKKEAPDGYHTAPIPWRSEPELVLPGIEIASAS